MNKINLTDWKSPEEDWEGKCVCVGGGSRVGWTVTEYLGVNRAER